MSYYKYTTFETTGIILENQSLRWSSPKLFNDIEELKFIPFTDTQYREDYKKYLNILHNHAKSSPSFEEKTFSFETQMMIQLFRSNPNTLSAFNNETQLENLPFFKNPASNYLNYISNILDNIRILSVTNQYNNKLMWAHYANQHNGCVLELEKIYMSKPNFLREGLVTYHEEFKPQSSSLNNFIYGLTEENNDLLIKDIVFSKGIEWAYENEYRFFFHENIGEIKVSYNLQTGEQTIHKKEPSKLYTDVKFEKESIKSIIFGTNVSKENIISMRNLALENQYEINFFQIKLTNNRDLIKEAI